MQFNNLAALLTVALFVYWSLGVWKDRKDEGLTRARPVVSESDWLEVTQNARPDILQLMVEDEGIPCLSAQEVGQPWEYVIVRSPVNEHPLTLVNPICKHKASSTIITVHEIPVGCNHGRRGQLRSMTVDVSFQTELRKNGTITLTGGASTCVQRAVEGFTRVHTCHKAKG